MDFVFYSLFAFSCWMMLGMALTIDRCETICRNYPVGNDYKREIIKSILFSFFYRLPKRVPVKDN